MAGLSSLVNVSKAGAYPGWCLPRLVPTHTQTLREAGKAC